MRLACLFGLVCLLYLAGCASAPGPDFAQVPATRVVVESSEFDIRVAGRTAQAIRVNAQYAPRVGPLGLRAAFAMEQVSGCAVRSLQGDAAVLIGRLQCDADGVTGPGSAPQGGSLDCYGSDSYVSAATDELVVLFDCDWRRY
jgi:hypothetical protein